MLLLRADMGNMRLKYFGLFIRLFLGLSKFFAKGLVKSELRIC